MINRWIENKDFFINKVCPDRQSEIKQMSNLIDEFWKQFDILPEKIFLNLNKINSVSEFFFLNPSWRSKCGVDVSELQSICTDDYIIYILTSVGAQLRGMSVLSFFSLLFLLEVGLGCKYEHSRRHRQGIIQKNIRQGRQLGNLGSTCELRDPRRFLQALVVSHYCNPLKLDKQGKGGNK